MHLAMSKHVQSIIRSAYHRSGNHTVDRAQKRAGRTKLLQPLQVVSQPRKRLRPSDAALDRDIKQLPYFLLLFPDEVTRTVAAMQEGTRTVACIWCGVGPSPVPPEIEARTALAAACASRMAIRTPQLAPKFT